LGSPNNGWIYQGSAAPQAFTTSSNSIQLTSSSTASSLSNVSITVRLNGNITTTLTSTVSLNTPLVTLAADQFSCTGLQFTLLGGTGSVYNWASNNGDILFDGFNTTATTTSNTINATGTTGTVSVTTTNACGVVRSAIISYDPFSRSIQGLYPEYTSGDHVSVSVNSTTYDTYYRWYINNILVGEGEYAYSYCTCYNGLDPRVCGENTIRVEVETSCGITSSTEAGFWKICGYYRTQNNIDLYPNPARDQVSVSLKEPKDNLNVGKISNEEIKIINLKEIVEIRIVDKLGNLKKYLKFGKGNKKVSFHINDLSSDIYYLEVSDGVNKAKIPLAVSK